MESDVLDSPLMFALAAAEIAGLDANAEAMFSGNEPPDASVLQGDFRIDFDVTDKVGLSIDHDPESGTYRVSATVSDPDQVVALSGLVLRGNHVVSERRRFSIDPRTDVLHLSEIIPLDGLDLDELAIRITSLCELMVALCESAAVAPAPAVGAAGSDAVMIRG